MKNLGFRTLITKRILNISKHLEYFLKIFNCILSKVSMINIGHFCHYMSNWRLILMSKESTHISTLFSYVSLRHCNLTIINRNKLFLITLINKSKTNCLSRTSVQSGNSITNYYKAHSFRTGLRKIRIMLPIPNWWKV